MEFGLKRKTDFLKLLRVVKLLLFRGIIISMNFKILIL
jgi:hypothetical protein